MVRRAILLEMYQCQVLKTHKYTTSKYVTELIMKMFILNLKQKNLFHLQKSDASFSLFQEQRNQRASSSFLMKTPNLLNMKTAI